MVEHKGCVHMCVYIDIHTYINIHIYSMEHHCAYTLHFPNRISQEVKFTGASSAATSASDLLTHFCGHKVWHRVHWDNIKTAEKLSVWTPVPAGQTAKGRGRGEGLIQVARPKVRVCLCTQKLAAKGRHTHRSQEGVRHPALKMLGKEAFTLRVKGAGNKSCHTYVKWKSVDVHSLKPGYVLPWHSSIVDTRKHSSTRFFGCP